LGDDKVLKMGTFVSATIAGTRREGVYRVSRSALKGASELLFVDDDDTIRIRAVNIVRSDADYAYIEGGIEKGERIILTAVESPVNGMRVRTQVAGE